jgi:hypothetical protein
MMEPAMSSSTRPPLQGSPATPAESVRGRPARAWVGRRDEAGAARRDEAFDALTDLFIGEAAGQSAERDARPGPARPVLRLAVDEPGEHVPDVEPKPGAVRSAPKPVVLGDPVVELVTTGNLPVLASAWASQYAREIAAAAGRPVAVLRVQAGFASVELVGQWPGEDTGDRDDGAVTGDLSAAIALASTRTDRWIIRCTAQEQGELMDLGLVRVVTLLTGADEMAAEAAAQAAEQVRRGLDLAGPDTPAVRVAVMGVVNEADRQAGRGVVDVVRSRLGDRHAVQPVVCSSRITSARASVSLFSGPTEQTLRATAASLARALGVAAPSGLATVEAAAPAMSSSPTFDAIQPGVAIRAEPPLDEAPASPPAALAEWAAVEQRQLSVDVALPTAPEASDLAGTAVAGSVDISLDELPLPDVPAASEPDVARPDRHTASAGPVSLMPWLAADGGDAADQASPAHAASEGVVPAFVPEMAAEEPAAPAARAPASSVNMSSVPSGLVGHVPGLSPLSARCPYAQTVEMGTDDAGSLHLLARHSAGAPDAALSDLLAAGAWARAHAQLLGLRLGTHGPTLHVFTDEPARVRRLLDTDVRVHLLASVGVHGTTAWVCRALN